MESVTTDKSKRSIFYKWLFSYILVILIPILCSSFVGYRLNQLMIQEIEKTNLLLIEKFKHVMDTKSLEIRELSVEVSANSHMKKLIEIEGAMKSEDRYNVLELMKDLSNYVLAKKDIDDFYVYLKNLDIVITPYEMLESKYFYQYSAKNSGTYDGWLSTIRKPQENYVSDFDGKDRKQNLIFIKSIPWFYNDKYGNLLISFNMTNVLSQTLDSKFHGNMMIIDEQDNILLSSKDIVLPKNFTYKDLRNDSGILVEQYSDSDMIISHMSSDVEKWKYVYMIPDEVYKKKTRAISQFILVMMLISGILSCFLAYYLARRNYKPIRSIINLVDPNESKHKQGNELHFIQHSIHDMIDEKTRLDQLINKQQLGLQKEYLRKLFRGEGYIDDIEMRNKALGLSFLSNYFAVLCIYIDQYDTQYYQQNDTGIIHMIIENVLKESVEEDYIIYMVNINNLRCCLVNQKEGVKRSNNNLVDIIKEVQSYIHQKFKIQLTMSISQWHEELEHIHYAYNQALEVMEYRFVIGDPVLVYQEIVAKNSNQSYYLPLESDRLITTAMKKGNYTKLESTMQHIFHQNFKVQSVSPKVAKLLIFELSSIIIKVYKDMDSMQDDLIKEVEDLQGLLYCDTIHEVKKGLLNAMKRFCDGIQKENSLADAYTRYDVKQYIMTHYTDPSLNISTIAEHFKLHPFYLSKLYKEKNGESILDTLSHIRIEAAKDLLEQYTVEEVAKRVGYTNPRTFTRGFKKIEGVTPGKYHKEKQS